MKIILIAVLILISGCATGFYGKINDARLLDHVNENGVLVISSCQGGINTVMEDQLLEVVKAGVEEIAVIGSAESACTMILEPFFIDMVCADPYATFEFHLSYEPRKEGELDITPNIEATWYYFSRLDPRVQAMLPPVSKWQISPNIAIKAWRLIDAGIIKECGASGDVIRPPE